MLYLQGYYLTMAHTSIDITDVVFLTCDKVLITCTYVYIVLVEMPMAQIPTYETKEGSLCQSNVIARHVARKLGVYHCISVSVTV